MENMKLAELTEKVSTEPPVNVAFNELKAYVCGPMTDCHDFNRDSFVKGAEIVESYGYEAITPVDIDSQVDHEGWEWSDYLRADLKVLTDCDVIALLPGWEESKGANLEYDTATRLGLYAKEIDLEHEVLIDHDPEEEPDPTILTEAQRLVYGPREASYGHPHTDFNRTAKIWSAILDTEVTAKQAALCMVGVKLSREVHRPKTDNLVDLAGYAAVADRIETYPDS